MAVAKKISAKTAKHMETFSYEGTNAQGAAVSTEVLAENLPAAKALLQKQGVKISKIEQKKKSFFAKRSKPVTTLDICYFSRQMSTMMTAGIPLVQSLDIVSKGVDKESLRKLIIQIKSEVEGGLSFSEVLKLYPQHFDPLFCNLIAAGEGSGALETMLERVATYKEKTESLKKKIKKALTYPIAVLVMALGVSAIMLIFVVPTFENLFQSFGANLPAFTQMVVNFSRFLQKWCFLILGIIIAAVYILKHQLRTNIDFQHSIERSMLKLPVLGDVLHKAAIARFTRTLSTTFAAGVPLVEGLESVAAASGNIVYSTAILQIKNEVSTGTQMQLAMRNSGIFPNMVTQMVMIGEESGSLDKMLGKVASIYEEEVDSAVDNLATLMEPMIMSILAFLVGSLVIAMYLPIFKMGSVV